MSPAPNSPALGSARLGLWDTVSIIVGIIVGVGIYKAPADVFTGVTAPGQVLVVWACGGLLALLGALCFAELASTYPRSGGEYVYLTRAYGPALGFLFGWAQLAVIRPGANIAMPAYIFAEAAAHLFDLGRVAAVGVAVGAILVLTLINLLGANPGRQAQNAFTIAKILSLLGIVIAGFFLAQPRTDLPVASAPPSTPFVVMMVAVLYAYGGWNEAAYVSAEVRNQRRNVPLALILGTLAVTAIYLLVNAAYIVGLGFEQARSAKEVGATEILQHALGQRAGQVMDVIVMVSVAGGLTGIIYTSSRLFSELGADHRLFAPLGRWHPRLGTPVCALVVQAAISIGMVVGVALIWKGKDGFEVLLNVTAPVYWVFFLLTGLALFVLRFREPDLNRPFRVPFYPLVPLVFCGWCGFLLCYILVKVGTEALVGVVILLAGLPLYQLSRWLERPPTAPARREPAESQAEPAPVSHLGD